MAPNFRLISTAPGQARIDITGLAIPAKDKGLEIAFQRASDELYIGSDGAWQSDPGWHRLARIADPATTAFLLGSGAVDALAEVSHADSFRASARWQDGQGEGVLRIAGELIGSAGLKREPAPEVPKGDDGAGPRPKPPLGPIPPGPLGPPDASLKTRPSLRWALPVGGAFVVLAAALWLGFGPGDPQQQVARHDSAAAPQQPGPIPSGAAGTSQTVTGGGVNGGHLPQSALEPETPPGQPKDPVQGKRTQAQPAADSSGPSTVEDGPAPTTYDAPQLRGREYVSWLVDQSPDAATYQSQAKQRAKQGDCPAVILLYDRAARSSPEVAAQVARLYDPVGFQPSPCIDQASPSNAREYYELAGEGGVQDVQPRLNEILSRGQVPAPAAAPIPANRTWENRQ